MSRIPLDFKDQYFGCEIELTGINRATAAQTLANLFGTRAEHSGGGYDAYRVKDLDGKEWKIVRDASIHPEGYLRSSTSGEYKVELNSPKLEYAEINHQQSGRDLMTPDEVRLLDNSKCILFIRGERPVIDLKYNLLKHPNIRYTEDGGAAPYDYTAADNARDDLPGAPENYELLDMDDFLPAEAAEMKPTIQRIRRPK